MNVLGGFAEQEPQRIALVWTDERHQGISGITLPKCRKRTNRLANLFGKVKLARGIGEADHEKAAMNSGRELLAGLATTSVCDCYPGYAHAQEA